MPRKSLAGFVNAQAGPSNAPSPGAVRGDQGGLDGDEAAFANAPLPHPAEDLSADDDLLSWILVDQLGALPGAKLGVHPQQVKFVGPAFKTEEVLTIVHETVIRGDISKAVEHLLAFHLIQAHMAKKRTYTQRERFISHLRRYLLMLMPSCKVEIHTTDRYSHITQHSELAIYATRPLNVNTVVDELQGSVVPLPEEWMWELDLGEEFAREAAGEESESDSEGEANPEKPKRMARRSERTKRRDFSIVWSSMKKCYQLFLGPARFLNHDCDPNVELLRQGKYVTFKVKRHIRIGEEVTTYYGPNYFGKNNIECLCLTCEKRQVGGFTPQHGLSCELTPVAPVDAISPGTPRSRLTQRASANGLRESVRPESDAEDEEAVEDGIRAPAGDVQSEEAASPVSHRTSTSIPSLVVDKLGKDTDTTVDTPSDDLPLDAPTPTALTEVGQIRDDDEDNGSDSGSESEESVAPRTRYERQATKKEKVWEWWRKKPKARKPEVEVSFHAEDEDLPDDFPRCATCAKPLMARLWFLGRYFDHCARCTRHALIFELPWPAHKHEDVQDYPPSHLIPNGYIPPRISTVPLPSLSRQPKKKLDTPISPTDMFPGRLDAVSKDHRAAIRFRMEIYAEEFVTESLRTASWTEQETAELAALEAIRQKQEIVRRKEEDRQRREEAKRKRDEQFTKGSGVWSRYEIVDKAAEEARILANTIGIVTGPRKRPTAGSYNENERKPQPAPIVIPKSASTTALASVAVSLTNIASFSARKTGSVALSTPNSASKSKRRTPKSPGGRGRSASLSFLPPKKRMRPDESLEMRQARTQKARETQRAMRLARLAAVGEAGGADSGLVSEVRSRKRRRSSGNRKPRRSRTPPTSEITVAVSSTRSANAEGRSDITEPQPKRGRGRPRKVRRGETTLAAHLDSDGEAVQVVERDLPVSEPTGARSETSNANLHRRRTNVSEVNTQAAPIEGKGTADSPFSANSDSEQSSGSDEDDSADTDFIGDRSSNEEKQPQSESPLRRSSRARRPRHSMQDESSSEADTVPMRTRLRSRASEVTVRHSPVATSRPARSESNSTRFIASKGSTTSISPTIATRPQSPSSISLATYSGNRKWIPTSNGVPGHWSRKETESHSSLVANEHGVTSAVAATETIGPPKPISPKLRLTLSGTPAPTNETVGKNTASQNSAAGAHAIAVSTPTSMGKGSFPPRKAPAAVVTGRPTLKPTTVVVHPVKTSSGVKSTASESFQACLLDMAPKSLTSPVNLDSASVEPQPLISAERSPSSGPHSRIENAISVSKTSHGLSTLAPAPFQPKSSDLARPLEAEKKMKYAAKRLDAATNAARDFARAAKDIQAAHDGLIEALAIIPLPRSAPSVTSSPDTVKGSRDHKTSETVLFNESLAVERTRAPVTAAAQSTILKDGMTTGGLLGAATASMSTKGVLIESKTSKFAISRSSTDGSSKACNSSTPATIATKDKSQSSPDLDSTPDKSNRAAAQPRVLSTWSRETLPPLSAFSDPRGPPRGDDLMRQWQKDDEWSEPDLAWRTKSKGASGKGHLYYRLANPDIVEKVALAKLAKMRMDYLREQGWWRDATSLRKLTGDDGEIRKGHKDTSDIELCQPPLEQEVGKCAEQSLSSSRLDAVLDPNMERVDYVMEDDGVPCDIQVSPTSANATKRPVGEAATRSICEATTSLRRNAADRLADAITTSVTKTSTSSVCVTKGSGKAFAAFAALKATLSSPEKPVEAEKAKSMSNSPDMYERLKRKSMLDAENPDASTFIVEQTAFGLQPLPTADPCSNYRSRKRPYKESEVARKIRVEDELYRQKNTSSSNALSRPDAPHKSEKTNTLFGATSLSTKTPSAFLNTASGAASKTFSNAENAFQTLLKQNAKAAPSSRPSTTSTSAPTAGSTNLVVPGKTIYTATGVSKMPFGYSGFSGFASKSAATSSAPSLVDGTGTFSNILSPDSVQKARKHLSFQSTERDKQSALQRSQIRPIAPKPAAAPAATNAVSPTTVRAPDAVL